MMTTLGDEHVLTVPELIELVNEHVRYKPGWSYQIKQCWLGDQERAVDVVITGPDTVDSTAYACGVTTRLPLQREMHVPAEYTRDAFLDKLFQHTVELDVHEDSEFFRVDGVAPFHAHSFDGRAKLEKLLPTLQAW